MALSYKKLFKLLIDKEMKKKELCELAGISTTTLSKMAKDQDINTEMLSRICDALNCDIGDIAENINCDKGEVLKDE